MSYHFDLQPARRNAYRYMGIASLILGLVALASIVLNWFYGFPLLIGFVSCIAGIVLGIISRARSYSDIALAGLILSVTACSFWIFGYVIVCGIAGFYPWFFGF
ncbi:MAG: hypothetical protein FWD45_03475 [Coriobacteriia bacterium]|nr:hypothetical protein [Coriobacteriia bacterium]